MISVEEALEKVFTQEVLLPLQEEIQLFDSLDRMLSQDVCSPIDMPPFRQSAMDGYAICGLEETSYTLIGEIKAGDSTHPKMKKGEAVAIYTGAAIPDDAEAVEMQEKIIRTNDSILLENKVIENQNIRPKGEQIRKGEIAIKKGGLIQPSSIGFLTGLGIEKVWVYKKPKISVLVTGNELVKAGKKLEYGEIYESNSIMLLSALKKEGLQAKSFSVKDDLDKTKEILSKLLGESNLLLISGGISVGKYDWVGESLEALGFETIFYKVKQKPGKPIYFGRKGEKFVFALPGNPAASLTCFYLYVLPLINKLHGAAEIPNRKIWVKNKEDYQKKGIRAEFLKAKIRNGEAEILEGQSSAMLKSFSESNGLVYIEESKMEIKKDEWVFAYITNDGNL